MVCLILCGAILHLFVGSALKLDSNLSNPKESPKESDKNVVQFAANSFQRLDGTDEDSWVGVDQHLPGFNGCVDGSSSYHVKAVTMMLRTGWDQCGDAYILDISSPDYYGLLKLEPRGASQFDGVYISCQILVKGDEQIDMVKPKDPHGQIATVKDGITLETLENIIKTAVFQWSTKKTTGASQPFTNMKAHLKKFASWQSMAKNACGRECAMLFVKGNSEIQRETLREQQNTKLACIWARAQGDPTKTDMTPCYANQPCSELSPQKCGACSRTPNGVIHLPHTDAQTKAKLMLRGFKEDWEDVIDNKQKKIQPHAIHTIEFCEGALPKQRTQGDWLKHETQVYSNGLHGGDGSILVTVNFNRDYALKIAENNRKATSADVKIECLAKSPNVKGDTVSKFFKTLAGWLSTDARGPVYLMAADSGSGGLCRWYENVGFKCHARDEILANGGDPVPDVFDDGSVRPRCPPDTVYHCYQCSTGIRSSWCKNGGQLSK